MAIIFVSSIPVIAVYVWFRLAKYQFTITQFLFTLLIGAAAFFPALFLQDILALPVSADGRLSSGQFAMFYEFFIRIAFSEELSRLLVFLLFFWIVSRMNKNLSQSDNENGQPLSWNTVKKGTAAGLVAGFGLAVLENAVYAVSNPQVLLIRTVTAAPLHAACGARVGAAAVMLRTYPFQSILRFITAVAIHGIYNLMVIRPGLPSIMAILVALSALFTAISTIRGGWGD